MSLEPVLIDGEWRQAESSGRPVPGRRSGHQGRVHGVVSGLERRRRGAGLPGRGRGGGGAARRRSGAHRALPRRLRGADRRPLRRAGRRSRPARPGCRPARASGRSSCRGPTNQLRQGAAAARDRSWCHATIDTKVNIRSKYGPLGGAVVVFGPNNFPFAFNSIAGGDFVAAIAAGNPVIGKANTGHPGTEPAARRAGVRRGRARRACLRRWSSSSTARRPTSGSGSCRIRRRRHGVHGQQGAPGLRLKEAADKAGKPIYLEMSSTNPVFVLPGALAERGPAIARELFDSCALGAGQFCTRPGITVVQEGAQAEAFLAEAAGALRQGDTGDAARPQAARRGSPRASASSSRTGPASWPAATRSTGPRYAFANTLLRASGDAFLAHPHALQTEAFGTVNLVDRRQDAAQMIAIAASLEGNLTGSIYSDTAGGDDELYARLEPVLRQKVGRLLNDKMPTGVAVTPAMNHGGPVSRHRPSRASRPSGSRRRCCASRRCTATTTSARTGCRRSSPTRTRPAGCGASSTASGRNGMSQGDLNALLGGGELLATTRTKASGPEGRLPITPEMLLEEPSGNLFGMTQDAGMGWNPAEVGRPQFLILSTQGGLRDADGTPVALGYHTGHWEIGLLVQGGGRDAARRRASCRSPPIAAIRATAARRARAGMFDSLPYRNDAAITMRRLIRSLPRRAGVMGIATCDKGLPATMLALAGCRDLPGIVVPGGVTLPAIDAEDAGKVQSIGARFAHGLITRRRRGRAWAAAPAARRAAAASSWARPRRRRWWPRRSGWRCRTARSAPSGEPVWLDMARRSARALVQLAANADHARGHPDAARARERDAGPRGVRRLDQPAAAHPGDRPRRGPARRRRSRTGTRINRATPRLVDALPNGPRDHPTVQVFMAGGVPGGDAPPARDGRCSTSTC